MSPGLSYKWFLAGLLGLHRFVAAQTCQVQTLQTNVPPDGTGVQLQSYSYCGGSLYVQSYVQNTDYDKIVTVYYTNADGESTPLSAVTLGYVGSIENTDWEYWSSTTPYVNLDGITNILNVTYQDTDAGVTYVDTVNVAVIASGAPPTTSTPPAPYATPTGLQQDITDWLQAVAGSEAAIARDGMFNNIEVANAANGTVIAAQSYTNPDYAYNWVRDSSLTMDVVQTLYSGASSSSQSKYESLLFRYAAARAEEQTDPNLQTGLGEPKFNLDNSVYTGPWGRPQNDGAATAAITLMEFSNQYLAEGGSTDTILQMIYDSNSYPSQAPVLKDLLFVASNWSSPSFDLWEEEESDHFYTRMVQHRSLVMGAAFANTLGDSGTASTLTSQAQALESTLSQFWDPIRNLILYEYGPVMRGKYSYKDTAVILGIIHGYAGDGVYSFTNDQVLASAFQIATCFIPIYNISDTQFTGDQPLGMPIGRYPEDVYDGTGTGLGNPWYLCTASMAELFYRAASEFSAAGSITVSSVSLPFWQYFAPQQSYGAGSTYSQGSAQYSAMLASLAGWGDAWIRTIKYYTPSNGSLTEEYNRGTGSPEGAADLTWSYASLLTASFARATLNGDQNYAANLANLPFSS